MLNKAMFDVMEFLNWTRCAIIYEQESGKLLIIATLIKLLNQTTLSGLINHRDLLSFSPFEDILVRSADIKSYYTILSELKDKEIYNIIIDIDIREMSDFLKAVRDL